MSKQNVQNLREQLLRNEQVRQMIQMRAYEIFQMRGGAQGNAAEDWLRAESEVIAYLLEQESKRTEQPAETLEDAAATPPMEEERAEGPRPLEMTVTPESADRISADRPADLAGQEQSGLGVWSPAEPASTELAPELGGATASAAPKKTRSRTSAAKLSPARKRRKSPALSEEVREAIEKLAKTTAKKKTPPKKVKENKQETPKAKKPGKKKDS